MPGRNVRQAALLGLLAVLGAGLALGCGDGRAELYPDILTFQESDRDVCASIDIPDGAGALGCQTKIQAIPSVVFYDQQAFATFHGLHHWPYQTHHLGLP